MKALIAEDEYLAARNLIRTLNDLGSIEVISTLDSIADTVDYFNNNNNNPDLLFVDSHLADGSAYEIFEKVRIACPVIFLLAYDEYALKAFQVNNADYLLKPFDIFDVKRALDKLQRSSRNAELYGNELKNLISYFKKNSKYKSNFLIPSEGDRLVPVKTDDIVFFYANDSVTKAYLNDGKSYSIDKNLNELVEILQPPAFFKANRQYIISKKAVRDIDYWFNGRLSLKLRNPVPEKIYVNKDIIPEFMIWYEGK